MLNYFHIFEIEAGFEIDKQYIEDKYLELQMLHHPDKQAGKSEQEKILSLKYSADINEAYSNLKSDVKRAEHLFELKGKNVAKERNNDFKPNQEILMLQMELNEKLVDEGKAAILGEVRALKKEATKNFNQLYIKGELEDAAQEYFKMKFLSKV